MPRKRRVSKLKARHLSWDDITLGERLDFWVGWWPPGSPGCELSIQRRVESPWTTWEEYLTAWVAVREEALPEWHERRQLALYHGRRGVAHREAELIKAKVDGEAEHWLVHLRQLHEHALERLADEEAREMPFAETAYQRALKGLQPQAPDDDYDVHEVDDQDLQPTTHEGDDHAPVS